MSDLSIVYQYFTLEQWRQIVLSVLTNASLTPAQTQDILSKCPSAALDIITFDERTK